MGASLPCIGHRYGCPDQTFTASQHIVEGRHIVTHGALKDRVNLGVLYDKAKGQKSLHGPLASQGM